MKSFVVVRLESLCVSEEELYSALHIDDCLHWIKVICRSNGFSPESYRIDVYEDGIFAGSLYAYDSAIDHYLSSND